ncbi:hypothetical protein CN941_21420 [Bacillus cereus]|uniref:Uncharacterized protein n=1 Tax=Bacillus cereus TaxID=1396 RepID=A0A2B8R044_BACCE|nr:hypothetical protein [Bacillus cereus]PET90559.1 hypothetical protein CN527_31495 [Bacillus cereus]PFA25998.1 hypothetical protein CN390_28440 [Bacillus cereus]PFL17933.1 hypothetical protein COJ07_21360 [Bacillus cereus]PFU37269.1 hypothetical protein COK86_29505 [Bacillus cereus]PGL33856.1 hypothetical protein CN930_20255 [Bacillus cereus]
MLQKKQLILIGSLFILILLFFGGYLFFNNKSNQEDSLRVTDTKEDILKSSTEGENKSDVQRKSPESFNKDLNGNSDKNKYYFVYLRQENGKSDISFVPETLNPGYDKTESMNISVLFDDNGIPAKDEKMILIYDYKISESNKQKIKEIAGEENYEKALKEIEERMGENRS